MARRSAFAGQRPVSDSSSSQEAQDAASPADTEAQASAASPTEQPASEAPKKQAKKGKVTFYLWPEDRDRAKAAYMHTMGHTNIPSWTQFLETAVREFTLKLEREHNDSRPFAQPE